MIPTFQSIDEAWHHAIECCLDGDRLESRVGGCLEVVGHAFQLVSGSQRFLVDPIRKLSSTYAAAELTWYLSQERDVEMISHYAPRYAEFANDGMAMGAYGWRWAHNPGIKTRRASGAIGSHGFVNQMSLALALLQKSPNTRQAIVVHWDSGDVAEAIHGQWKDIPCTLSLQFILREDKLHMVVSMRSNDVWLGMPYDVFCFSGIQRIMADALGVDAGSYTHFVGSLHAYDRDLAKLEECYEMGIQEYAEPVKYRSIGVNAASHILACGINYLTVSEEVGRVRPESRVNLVHKPAETFVDDLIHCLYHKTMPAANTKALIKCDALRGGLR